MPCTRPRTKKCRITRGLSAMRQLPTEGSDAQTCTADAAGQPRISLSMILVEPVMSDSRIQAAFPGSDRRFAVATASAALSRGLFPVVSIDRVVALAEGFRFETRHVQNESQRTRAGVRSWLNQKLFQ